MEKPLKGHLKRKNDAQFTSRQKEYGRGMRLTGQRVDLYKAQP